MSAPEVQRQESYPDFAVTEQARARWDVSVALATRLSEQSEPGRVADPTFVRYFARTVFRSDAPTGELAPLEEAEADDGTAAWLARLDAEQPGDDADAQAHWDHVGRLTDFLEHLFGNPDDFGMGDYEGPPQEPGDGLSHLQIAEWFEHVVRKPYNGSMHPRDRAGKWAHSLNAVRSFAKQHRDRLRGAVVERVAARQLARGVRQASKPGGAFHGDVAHGGALHPHAPPKMPHLKKVDPAARMRAHAQEERNRRGLKGARQRAIAGKTIAHGSALQALAYAYSEKAAHKMGPFSESIKDASAGVDTLENAKMTREAVHEAVHYAHENREAIHHVLRAAGHVAKAVARHKGLIAAEDAEREAGERLLEADPADLELADALLAWTED